MVHLNLETEVLKILMTSGGYVSGAKLAQLLGVSRSTVNRVVRRLIAKGFVVEVHPRLGYRLANIDALHHVSRYAGLLDTELRFNVHYVEVCDSTQDIALALAREGAQEGTVVIAEELRRGRGRLGRQWIATRGGLWTSIILRPRALKYMHLLSLAMAVAVAETLNSLLGVEAKVKWPNDVLIGEKKVAGILIEGSAEADVVHYVVVGVGVNVNNSLPNELLDTAITLRDVLGFEIPRVPLFLNMLKSVDAVYSLFNRNLVSEIIKKWRRLSSTLNRYVKVITLDGEFAGFAEDVEEDGALVLRTEGGAKVKVYSGDVIHAREQRQS